MPDIPTVAAIISGVKNSIDIATAIKAAGASLEQAERNLQLAGLIESLVDVKLQAAEIKESVEEKDKRIAELEEALANKGAVVHVHGAYHMRDGKGRPTGYPICSYCWEVNHRLIHLVQVGGWGRVRLNWKCPACKTTYHHRALRVFKGIGETKASDALPEPGNAY